jgi:hypothetical protein
LRLYLFGISPITLYCGGGSPPAPPPPPPPPQLAKTPDVQAIKASTRNLNVAQGGVSPSTTLLNGAAGDLTPLDDKLGKKTVLGA